MLSPANQRVNASIVVGKTEPGGKSDVSVPVRDITRLTFYGTGSIGYGRLRRKRKAYQISTRVELTVSVAGAFNGG